MLVLLYRILQSLDISFFHLTPLLSSRARRNNLFILSIFESKLNCFASHSFRGSWFKSFCPSVESKRVRPRWRAFNLGRSTWLSCWHRHRHLLLLLRLGYELACRLHGLLRHERSKGSRLLRGLLLLIVITVVMRLSTVLALLLVIGVVIASIRVVSTIVALVWHLVVIWNETTLVPIPLTIIAALVVVLILLHVICGLLLLLVLRLERTLVVAIITVVVVLVLIERLLISIVVICRSRGERLYRIDRWHGKGIRCWHHVACVARLLRG